MPRSPETSVVGSASEPKNGVHPPLGLDPETCSSYGVQEAPVGPGSPYLSPGLKFRHRKDWMIFCQPAVV